MEPTAGPRLVSVVSQHSASDKAAPQQPGSTVRQQEATCGNTHNTSHPSAHRATDKHRARQRTLWLITATQATRPTGREPLPTPAPEREVLVTPAPDGVAIPGASLNTDNRRWAGASVRQEGEVGAGDEGKTRRPLSDTLVHLI